MLVASARSEKIIKFSDLRSDQQNLLRYLDSSDSGTIDKRTRDRSLCAHGWQHVNDAERRNWPAITNDRYVLAVAIPTKPVSASTAIHHSNEDIQAFRLH